jgi:hypothetical protein
MPADKTLLIRGDVLLPRSMTVESHPYAANWRQVVESGSALGGRIDQAKWNFFYLAGEIKATVFGGGEKAEHRAVEEILAGLEPNRFNCLEITSTKLSHLLGMARTTVTAHSRHIQESNRLREPRWNH